MDVSCSCCCTIYTKWLRRYCEISLHSRVLDQLRLNTSPTKAPIRKGKVATMTHATRHSRAKTMAIAVIMRAKFCTTVLNRSPTADRTNMAFVDSFVPKTLVLLSTSSKKATSFCSIPGVNRQHQTEVILMRRLPALFSFRPP